MTAIGVAALWAGYWLGISGYSMVRGWNNNVLGLANPLSSAPFTTKCYVGGGFWPTGAAGDSGSCGSSSSQTITTTNLKKGEVGGTNRDVLKNVGHGYHG